MKNLRLIFVCLFVCVCTSVFSQAKHEPAKPAVNITDKAGWHWLASTAAELSTDKDAVAVFGKDKFKALRVKATDHAIHINSIRVYYEDGTSSVLEVNTDLKAGESSKDLSTDATKEIKKVAYVYNAMPNKNNEKARLELYGQK